MRVRELGGGENNEVGMVFEVKTGTKQHGKNISREEGKKKTK